MSSCSSDLGNIYAYEAFEHEYEHFMYAKDSKMEEVEKTVDAVHVQVASIERALINDVWSKRHGQIADSLKFNTTFLLAEMFEMTFSTELKAKVLATIKKIEKIIELTTSGNSHRTPGSENQLAGMFNDYRRNLVAGYNTQTVPVPVQLVETNAWHGEAIKKEYLDPCCETNLSIEKFLSSRSSRILQRGEYLIRPCTALVNGAIEYYVMESKSISDGSIKKFLFTYSPATTMFSAFNDTVAFSTFEAFKASVIWSGYIPCPMIGR